MQMIGAITTYLVILIQIGEMPSPEAMVNMTIGINGTDAWDQLKTKLTWFANYCFIKFWYLIKEALS